MRNIDEYNITQAVIAHHAAAADARLREVMTSLVQHLHAFAREVKLTESEWLQGLRFVTECSSARDDPQQELKLLSDTLGLSMLVTAQNHRKPKGCTEATVAGAFQASGAPALAPAGPGRPCAGAPDDAALDERCPPLQVNGRVCRLDGTAVAGAVVQAWRSDAVRVPGARPARPAWSPACATLTSDDDGRFHFSTALPQPHPVPQDGPVGRLLRALGRHAWRPAHLHFNIRAAGCLPLATQVFRAGDAYLDSDAMFAVRSSLLAEWVQHAPGPGSGEGAGQMTGQNAGQTPDGQSAATPFYTMDFTFVLNATTGDRT